MADQTHYVPEHKLVIRGHVTAVCGAFIASTDRTGSPTCPTCRDWLQRQADDDRETARALEEEFPDLRGHL